jgi:hypothetical protein
MDSLKEGLASVRSGRSSEFDGLKGRMQAELGVDSSAPQRETGEALGAARVAGHELQRRDSELTTAIFWTVVKKDKLDDSRDSCGELNLCHLRSGLLKCCEKSRTRPGLTLTWMIARRSR